MASGFGLREFDDTLQDMSQEVTATVVQNDKKCDPDQLGRIRVRIPHFTDDEENIPDDLLPLVYPIAPRNTGGEASHMVIPEVGTKVSVKMIDNDPYQWQVTNHLMTTKHEKLDWLRENYPNTWGMEDRTGSGYRLNMEIKEAIFKHTSKTQMKIEASGSTTIQVKDWLDTHVYSYAKWQYDGYYKKTVNEYANYDYKQHRTTTIDSFDTTSIKSYRAVEISDRDTLVVNGEISITSTGGQINIFANNSINMNSSQDINISASGKVSITGQKGVAIMAPGGCVFCHASKAIQMSAPTIDMLG